MFKGELVTVVMPMYNEERTLRHIAEKVLAHPAVDELLIVDDCSTDESYRIVQWLKEKDKRVKLIPNLKNMGKGAIHKRKAVLRFGRGHRGLQGSTERWLGVQPSSTARLRNRHRRAYMGNLHLR